jgi:hypothetical protein
MSLGSIIDGPERLVPGVGDLSLPLHGAFHREGPFEKVGCPAHFYLQSDPMAI